MSSMIRRIQRQVMESLRVHPELDIEKKPIEGKGYCNPAREVFYNQRGHALGTSNPKDACLLARRKREQRVQ